MAWFHNISARRRDVRRSLPRTAPWEHLTGRYRELLWASLFALTLIVVAGSISAGGKAQTRYVVNQVLMAPLVARVDFRAVDAVATNERKKAAGEREPAVYVPNPALPVYVREQIALLERLAVDDSVKNIDQVQEKLRLSLELTQPGLDQLKQLVIRGQPTPYWKTAIEGFVDSVNALAILAPERASQELDERQLAIKIRIQHPRRGETDRYRNEILNIAADTDLIRERLTQIAAEQFPKPLPRSIVALMMQNMPPVYLYDDALTRQRKTERSRIEPDVEKVFVANDVFIQAGKELTADDIRLIERENETYATVLAQEHPSYPWLATLGRFGMIAVVVVSLWGYILAYNRRIAQNAMRGLAVTGLLIISLLAAVSTASTYPRLILAMATFPTLIAGMVMAIAYDRRFALTVASLQTALVIFALGLGIDAGMVMLVGAAVAIGQIDEVRSRSKLLSTGVWSGLAMALTVAVVGLAMRPLHLPGQISQILSDMRSILIAAAIAGLLVQGLLPIIERVFRVTTSLSLKELNDASTPLLRRLAQEAPGTYQHSLRMADMAEAAAEAVHANTLLCRVGAMYHDIGKINKPQYFVENQAGGPNRHEKLSPAMSLLIIIAHVKDGVEFAREYGLPVSVRQFIETHHGTTLVEYFYHAARAQSDHQDMPLPSEYEYRYPGPKPQSREAAIMMICDCVEGAARTLPDPTPQRLEGLVHKLSQRRLLDGQFNECGISLRELHIVEQSVIKTLTAMYHGRIKYPSDRVDEEDSTTEPHATTEAAR